MSEIRLQMILDAAHEGIIQVARDGTVLALNKSAAELLQIPVDSAVGRPYAEILLRKRGDEGNLRFVREALDAGRKSSTEKIYAFTPEGTRLSVACTCVPIVENQNNVSGIITLWSLASQAAIEEKLKDAIQEQLKNEQKLREALAELQKLNEQLRAAQDQLIQSEKMRSVGQLAAGVAHEVKNPLAILLQGAEYLEKALVNPSSDVKEVVSDMIEAVKRADTVIVQLLDFASPSEPEKIEVDIHEVLNGVLNLVKHLISAHSIEVKKVYGTQLTPIKMDKNGIEQVLINLITNAIYAMPEGGTLTLSTDIGYKEGKDKIVIYIEDTGSGIPAELMGKIFEPFMTTRRGRGGTGLGLAVARSIIQKHGGDIVITNRPRPQTGVKVTLLL